MFLNIASTLLKEIHTMKTKSFYLNLLLKVFLLGLISTLYLPNSFAQDFRPIVRLIYFVPSDRQPQPDIDAKFDKLIKDVQLGYEDIMEAHGFGKKTFLFETDGNGNAMVHTLNGQEPEKHYNDEQHINMGGIASEIREQIDDTWHTRNIYLVAIDISSKVLGGSAQIGGIAQAYRTHEGGGGLALIPDSGPNFSIRVAAHELGHTFGLNHDFRSDAKLVESDIFDFSNLFFPTSICAAEWLDVNRFFNAEQPISNEEPTIDMLPPSFVSFPNIIRLRFKVTDHNGIHQVQLRMIEVNNTSGHSLLGCKKLNVNLSTTVEFVTSSLTTQSEFISLQMIDVHGNISWSEEYPIDVLSLLPPPEAIFIPDPILREAVRSSLKLTSDEPITQLNILDLRHLGVPYNKDRKVKDLTGLEYASNLRNLWIESAQNIDLTPITSLNNLQRLSFQGRIQDVTPITALKNLDFLSVLGSQIQDITPFTQLTHLSELNLSGNRISDISPIAKLTNLTFLSAYSNSISDITPLAKLTRLTELNLNSNQISNITSLAGLTNLNRLWLNSNQIKDVNPLTGLVNLQVIHLEGNPIENRKPLLAFLEKNPDVKIYLKHGSEPLPVTLSHFRAEHTDAGVLLKWTTESEVDNAGFFIYRSETKDGKFKVVNPQLIQGAGTTGERNEYTWTDRTAKPNTVYYYRIEDVSHAGVREKLATVRLRGLVSASGKLTTRWADLRMRN